MGNVQISVSNFLLLIYTTNAMESLNRVIRKSISNRKIFPNDQSALKVIYLAIQKASQK